MIRRDPQRFFHAVGGVFFVGAICAMLALGFAKNASAQAGAAPFDVALCQVTPRDSSAGAADKAAKKRARAQLIVARRAYEASDYATSIKALRDSYTLEPILDTLFNIAQVCREAGAVAEAIPLYEFTIKQSDDDNIKAECQRHLGVLRPKVAQAHDQRAQELIKSDQSATAIGLFEQAYKLDAQPIYLQRLADAQRRSGQLAEAIATYERLSAIGTADDLAKSARGTALKLRAELAAQRAQKHAQAEEHAQAFAAWQEANQFDPQPRYVFQIAESAQRSGLQRDALASYQRFLNMPGSEALREERQQAQSHVVTARLREQEERRVVEGRRKPVYKKWWFWTAIGGTVAAAAIVGGIVGAMNAPKSTRLTDLPSQNVVDL